MPATVAAPAAAIVTAGDPAWDEARQAWNLALGQPPLPAPPRRRRW
jgi:hypothetical protein